MPQNNGWEPVEDTSGWTPVESKSASPAPRSIHGPADIEKWAKGHPQEKPPSLGWKPPVKFNVPHSASEQVGDTMRGVAGMVPAAFAPPKTDTEMKIATEIPEAAMPIIAAKRALIDPQISEWEKGNKLAALVPIFGPIASSIYEAYQRGEDVSAALQSLMALSAAHETAPHIQSLKRIAADKVKQLARSAGPGEGVARELVKKTGEANEKAAVSASEATAKAEKVRQGKIAEVAKKHAEDKAKLEAAKAKAATETAKQKKIAPTNAKLDTAHRNLQAGIETAREKALQTGNEKYTAVNKELNPIEVNPDFYEKSLSEAVDSIKGSAPEPTFLGNIAKRMKAKEPIRYEDLQADYSRLGRELSKGTLPGDVYHAYDQIHEAIGQEMQTIADTKGMGAQLTEARDYWRRMKQAFGKSRVPSDEATEALRTSDPERYAKTIQDKRVNLQGSFDPRLPGLYEHIENLKKGAESLPKPVPAREIQRPVTEANPTAPKVPSKAPPVMPDVQKIGTEETRAANAEAFKKQRQNIVNRIDWAAAGAGIVGPIIETARAMVGKGGGLGNAAAEGVLGATLYGAAQAVDALLQKPAVVKFFTEPTAAQLSHITTEMRGQIRPIIKAAQSKGIAVNPKLLRAAGVTVAAANSSDAWSGPQQ